jgi:hypothetical protein
MRRAEYLREQFRAGFGLAARLGDFATYQRTSFFRRGQKRMTRSFPQAASQFSMLPGRETRPQSDNYRLDFETMFAATSAGATASVVGRCAGARLRAIRPAASLTVMTCRQRRRLPWRVRAACRSPHALIRLTGVADGGDHAGAFQANPRQPA